jgi:predicted DNA-binding protein YlxM (UPF0122 family)
MNKATQEYLEWLENLPKNGRDPERINWAFLFDQAQNGDMDALNYLYETNEYIIHKVLSEATDFIDPDLDIQVYIDLMTDVLIRGIRDYNHSFHTSFRQFVKRNMYSKLREYAGKHKKLHHVLETTSPISEYDTPTNEETYPLANDVRNIAYDQAAIGIYLDEKPKNNAQSLWEKLKVFASEEELDLLYRYHINGESQEEIAKSYNTSRQMISFRIGRVQNRLKNRIKAANFVYKHLKIDNLPISTLMQQMGIKDYKKIYYYLSVYEYLYQDGPLPESSDPYGYKQYKPKSHHHTNKTNRSEIFKTRQRNKQLGE